MARCGGRALRLDGAGEQGRFPLAHPEKGLTNRMWEAMADGKPYPIKAFFAAGGNGFMSGADFDTIHRALENLDFFVAADVMPNEMNMYADILLPEASYLERYDDLQTGGAREGYVALRSPAMAPLHDTRDAWSICKGIAERLDLGHYFPTTPSPTWWTSDCARSACPCRSLSARAWLKSPPTRQRTSPGVWRSITISDA